LCLEPNDIASHRRRPGSVWSAAFCASGFERAAGNDLHDCDLSELPVPAIEASSLPGNRPQTWPYA